MTNLKEILSKTNAIEMCCVPEGQGQHKMEILLTDLLSIVFCFIQNFASGL